MIAVYSPGAKRVLATINMGFDSRDPDAGPFLDPLNPQSRYAKAFLQYFVNMINEDKAYLKRLQSHYVMFKEKVEKRPYRGKPFERAGTVVQPAKVPLPLDEPNSTEKPRVGRNAPCPCGSGKKYKKCCLNKTRKNIKSDNPKTATAKTQRLGSGVPKDSPPIESSHKAGGAKAREMLKNVSLRLSTEKSDPLTANDINVLEENPKLASDFLSIVIQNYSAKKGQGKRGVHYEALLLLMQESLTQLRYSVDRKRPWAVDADLKIQKEMAENLFRLSVDFQVQSDILKALHASGLVIHPQIKEKTQELAEYYSQFQTDGAASHKRLFEGLAKAAKGDPFELYEQVLPNLTILSREGKVQAILEMVQTGNVLLGEMAVLMFLYPDAQIREDMAMLLDNVMPPENVTPRALRWMIGFRNWLPKNEQTGVDRLIQKARRARVDCAAMPQSSRPTLYASVFDGSGMQFISGISEKKRASHMAHVLVRQGEGIRESRVSPRLSNSEKKSLLRRYKSEAASLKVDEAYLKKLVPHFLHLGRKAGRTPPPVLLAAAENLIDEYWRPRALDFEKEVVELEAHLPPEFRKKEEVQKVLENSRDWPDKDFGYSWFEDDARVDEYVRNYVGRSRGKPGGVIKAQQVILKDILEAKRRDWGERIFWMALRSLLCPERRAPVWAPFLIVSREILSGVRMRNIPLMEAVAERSVWSGLRRLNEFPE